MPASVGKDYYLYYSSGTVTSPTWVLVSQIGDVAAPDMSVGLAELKRRASNYVKNLATFIQSISITFKLIHGLDSTVFDIIRGDFFGRTAREWAMMDGPIATVGSQGLRLPALVAEFPWDQSLEEVSAHDCKLVTAYLHYSSGTLEAEPSWMTITE